jgi:hypothetical protein
MSAVQPEGRSAALSALHDEAVGLFRVYFFGAPDGVRLLVGAATGDSWSRDMLTAISDSAHHITSAPKRRPALCLTCPTPLRALRGLLFSVVVPEVTRASHALASALCPKCAALPDLEKRAMIALRQIWPDLREISVMPAPDAMQ